MKIFKAVSLSSALALGLVIGSAAASAASSDTEYIKVNVPFSFVLAGKVFPAGTYSVHENQAGVILVQGQGTGAMAMTVPVSTVKPGSTPTVRFTSANGREYLVSFDDDTNTRAVSTHDLETRTLTLSH